MKRFLGTAIAALAFIPLTTGSALAGGSPGSIGLGAEYQVSGLGGLSITYDQGDYHLGGFLGFSDGSGDDDSDFTLGGRFFYHVHSTAHSDFSVGGSIGIAFIGDRSPQVDNGQTLVFLEPSAQIRVFLVQNVALSFTGGIALGMVDADGVLITGQTTGAAGVHYYFF